MVRAIETRHWCVELQRARGIHVTRLARLFCLIRTGNVDIAVLNKIAGTRRLYRRAVPKLGNWSVRRLNSLHRELPKVERYLEIGLSEGRTFENVSVPARVGVDPVPRFRLEALPPHVAVHVMTSDEFFAQNEEAFDMVFLDGLHTYVQTYRDLVNALEVCPTGPILIDDVIPTDEVSAMPDMYESLAIRKEQGLSGFSWHGDVYRLAPCLRDHHPELEWRTILGSGNPQLLLWKKDPTARVTALSAESLEGYASVSYDAVLGNGIPDYFRPSSEDQALADCVDTIIGRA